MLGRMSNDRFAVSVKDAAGAYVRANDAFTNLLGVSPEDLPGLTDEQVQPRDVAETLVANDRSAMSASGPLLVEERVFDRLGLRKIAACRVVTTQEGRTLVWRVSGPPPPAAEVAAEAERLRMAVSAPMGYDGEEAEAPIVAEPQIVVERSDDRERALERSAAIDDARARIGRLEAELAEARSQAALPDPRGQAALRALAGV